MFVCYNNIYLLHLIYTVIFNPCQIGGTEQRNMIFPFWASTDEETYLEEGHMKENVYDFLRCESVNSGGRGGLWVQGWVVGIHFCTSPHL